MWQYANYTAVILGYGAMLWVLIYSIKGMFVWAVEESTLDTQDKLTKVERQYQVCKNSYDLIKPRLEDLEQKINEKSCNHNLREIEVLQATDDLLRMRIDTTQKDLIEHIIDTKNKKGKKRK